MKFACVLLVALVASGANALSSGAPTAACVEMTPQHGPSPQPLPAPYTLTAEAIDASRYQVTITADSGVTFKGFLIQARSSQTNTAVGSFDPSDEAQSIECFGNVGSASTHVTNDDKTTISVVWNVPASGESVVFLASVVQEYNTFWVQIPVTIV